MNITAAIKWIETSQTDKLAQTRDEYVPSAMPDSEVYEEVDRRDRQARRVVLNAAKMHVRGARFLFDVVI